MNGNVGDSAKHKEEPNNNNLCTTTTAADYFKWQDVTPQQITAIAEAPGFIVTKLVERLVEREGSASSEVTEEDFEALIAYAVLNLHFQNRRFHLWNGVTYFALQTIMAGCQCALIFEGTVDIPCKFLLFKYSVE